MQKKNFSTFCNDDIFKVEAGAALSEELGKAKKSGEDAKTKGERIKTLEEELRQVWNSIRLLLDVVYYCL